MGGTRVFGYGKHLRESPTRGTTTERHSTLRNHERAFTQLELIVVVLLLLILVALVLVRFGRAEDQRAEREAVVALEHLYQLESMYFLKHQRYNDDLAELGFERGGTDPIQPARYFIRVESADEQGFMAVAVPLETGLKTFRLDQDGKLRNAR